MNGSAWNTMLLIDGDRVNLYDFMRDNWEPQVDHLSEEQMRSIFALRVGEEYTLNLGAHGTTVIKRIG